MTERIFGYCREDLLGRPVEILLPEDLRTIHSGHRQTYIAHPRARPIAENGMEAISILRKAAERISAILLDMTMPVMSGAETLRQVREFQPDIPVILSSGFNEMEALERFPGKVIEGFVQKPYTAAQLLQKINAICGQRRTATGFWRASRGAPCRIAAEDTTAQR